MISSDIGFTNNKKILYFLAITALILCGFNIFGSPVYILDEAKNAEAAREMFESGNFIVPTFNGMLRTDKPPLHYFFMMVGYFLFGENPLGARFFSAVFGMLTVLSTHLFVRKFKGDALALVTSFILLSSFYFIQEFHLSVPDPYLIFFISFSLFSFYSYTATAKFKYILWSYIAIGLGVLAKGPVAMALPGLIMLIYLIATKQFTLKKIWKMQPALGLIIIALISVPWFYLVDRATKGKWTHGFFFEHNLERFSEGKEGHGGLFIITLLFVFLGMLPFSAAIPQAFKNAWKNRKQDNLLLFSAIVAVVITGFFSISSTKLPNYPMPCYPFIAVVLAYYLHKIYTLRAPKAIRGLKISTIVLLVISILLPPAGFIALATQPSLAPVKWHALWLIILPVGSYLAYEYLKQEMFKKAFLTAVITWGALTVFLFGFIYPALLGQNPVTVFQKSIAGEENPQMVVYKSMDSAFPFNFGQTFTIVENEDELAAYLAAHPGKVYVISNSRSGIKELEALPDLELTFKQRALFENHTTCVFVPNG